jgi:hypothetical protein
MSSGTINQFRSRRTAFLHCFLFKAQNCMGKTNDLIISSAPDFEFYASNGRGRVSYQMQNAGGVIRYSMVSRQIQTNDEVNVSCDDKILLDGILYTVVSCSFIPEERTMAYMKQPYGITLINLRR